MRSNLICRGIFEDFHAGSKGNLYSKIATPRKLNADKAATALAEKEEALKTLNHKLEIVIASEIESVQAIKTLQGKMDVMKEQNELSHAYLDAIKKIEIV